MTQMTQNSKSIIIYSQLSLNALSLSVCTIYFLISANFWNTNQSTQESRCDVYLAGNLHIYLYPKRKGLDWSIGKRGVSGASIG